MTLAIEGVATTVSVTASQGVVQDVAATGQAVTIVDEVGIEMNAKEVVGQAVAEQTGVHLLRTSPTMAGIYVRGLTGAKVNVFVDGVRYSTSTARGGVNTFLDLIEPTNLQGVEVLRGANSAQYGSDALGGSVQFLSQVPSLAGAGGAGVHGIFAARGGTASSNVGAQRWRSATRPAGSASSATSRRGPSTTCAPATGSTRTRRSPDSSACRPTG